MKLRLPSILLSALVAAQMCTTANADTVVASGVSYDVGKANHYYSGAYTGYNEDYLHCWAAAASNAIQNWQDKYSGNAVTSSLPNGVIASPSGSAEGTANLAVYKTILDNSAESHVGTASEAYNWWFRNQASGEVLTAPRAEGDYYNVFGSSDAGIKQGASGWYFNANDLKSAFEKSGGNAVALQISQSGNVVPTVDPDLGELTGDCRSHAITCWGYETDEAGNVTAAYLSDSDDLSYGIFKANTQYESRYNAVMEYQYQMEGIELPGLYLDTDDKHGGYNTGMEVRVLSAEMINTPAGATLNDGASTTPSTAPDADGKVTQNTKLTANTAISGKGVSVGSGEEGKLVMLTSENGKELNLTGNGAATSGLSVEHGSLASLDNVSISGYNGSGVELEGRGYLHDGTVSIKDNHATNGGAVKTSTYLEIEGNTKVDISGNTASNKGGGIYNGKDGIVSIFGNTEVTFSNNTAANGGSDIYNAKGGIVNIYNNNKVEFKSSGAAVRNEGELYVAAQAGNDVTFTGSSLDSRGGTTYVGTDLSGDATDSQGGVKFTNEEGTKTLSVKAASDTVTPRTPVRTSWTREIDGKTEVMTGFDHYEQRTPATLENVTVNVNEIAGTSAKASSVTGANIVSSGDLLMKSLTLDASDTIKTTSGDINMTNTVIKLKDFSHTTEGSQHTFDLSGLTAATGTLTLNNVVFDTTGMDLDIGADDTVLITFAPTVELTDAQLSKATGTNLRGELQGENAVIFHGNNLAPEPATATLSLLALAALAARRKRH